MLQVLLWLLPIIDVFALKQIVTYYRSLGVRVPISHAKLGTVERWVGYLPAGFIICWFSDFLTALLLILFVLAVIDPLELYLMNRGVRPWRFLKRKPPKLVTKIFLFEGYNAIGYYLLGALLALFVNI
ncbi:MAG: hypothetical protein E3J91_03520 [Hadesarchaea archaeon]|nr:MAG: hypothetical protein E3J91_03520 [Hadesarchaea archaeon]